MSTMGSTTANGPRTGGDAQGASSTTEQAKEKVQETAQQAAGQARGRLREQVDQRSTQAGEQVSSTADDVRTVAQTLREQGKDQPAKVAEQAAQRAERLGTYLKQADGDTILRDVEDFGRRQPWAVMFGGLAAGFLASRFLKASSSRRYESGYQATGRPYGGDGGYAGRAVVPPATSVPPVPTTGEDVSLSGGVMPSRPGATY
jgi:gas vesicle protein